MDIEGLTDLITLAQCKSFSKAAELRHVTQPAFSRRIQALESSLDTKLIDRSRKGFKLTPAGERLLVHAAHLVDSSQRAVTDVKSVATRLHEPVYITAPAYLSKTFFPPWYKKMQAAVSGLTMRISHQRGSDAVNDLRKKTTDFALILHAAKVESCYAIENLDTVVIGRDKMIAVMSKHAVSADQLLMYEQGSYMNACAEFVLNAKAKKVIAKENVVFETSSTGLLKEMAVSGFGVAVLPESIVEDDLADGFLVRVPNLPELECAILLVRADTLSGKKAEKLWAANN